MQGPEQDEFFIGYAPPVPPRIARFVGTVVRAAIAGAGLWAGIVVGGHASLDGGSFEYGRPRTLTGTILERPYPVLVPHAGGTAPLLLVAPGKHGAGEMVGGLDRRTVSLSGAMIHRDGNRMLEVVRGSIIPQEAVPGPGVAGWVLSAERPAGVTLIGEIVDSKCFLGVMVPGSGKTHRACAALCLRGGIPPALHVRDQAGRSALLLLAGRDGEPIAAEAAGFAGDAVTITGTVDRFQQWLVLRSDPASWRRLIR